jgi:hypothetical protein
MNNKLRLLEDEIDSLNPRFKIEQSLLPRLERARDSYSVEPDVYTVTGKRVLKRPKLNGFRSQSKELSLVESDFDDYTKGVKYYFNGTSNDAVLVERARIRAKLDKLRQLEHIEQHQLIKKQDQREQEKELKPIIIKLDSDQKASKLIPANISGTNERRVLFKDEVENKGNDYKVEEAIELEILKQPIDIEFSSDAPAS